MGGRATRLLGLDSQGNLTRLAEDPKDMSLLSRGAKHPRVQSLSEYDDDEHTLVPKVPSGINFGKACDPAGWFEEITGGQHQEHTQAVRR